jgi:hypothetical protein
MLLHCSNGDRREQDRDMKWVKGEKKVGEGSSYVRNDFMLHFREYDMVL